MESPFKNSGSLATEGIGLVKCLLISGTSDLLKTITTCSVILHACSQLKFYLDILGPAKHEKGGVFNLLRHFSDVFYD